MRILIIRHGDPDYERDSLTEKGWREVELLAERLEKTEINDFYVSPLGRARDTAQPTLKRHKKSALICDWLQEFPPQIQRPDKGGEKTITWDWLPQDWTADARYFQAEEWYKTEIMQAGNVEAAYRHVTEGLDRVLAEHGYVREGKLYRAEKSNRETIAFFCHFGLECVLLSHLMNVSPHDFMASCLCSTLLCNYPDYRGTPSGKGGFPHEQLWGYFPSVCWRGRFFLSGKILRNL